MAAPAILAKGSHEGMLILDGTNRVTVVTAEVERADVSATEAQAVGAAGIVRCRRPIVTAATCKAKRPKAVAACSRKEQRNTIGFAGDEITTIITSKSGPTRLPSRFSV